MAGLPNLVSWTTFLPLLVGVALIAANGALRSLGADGLPERVWKAVGLAATLIGATLIEYDGFRVPRRLFAPLVAAALGLPAIWPRIRPLALAANLQVPAWQAGLLDGLAGLAAGLILGTLVAAGWRLA